VRRFLLACLPMASLLLLAGCAAGHERRVDHRLPPEERGEVLAHELLIVDTHIDTPYRLHVAPFDLSRRAARGHFDAVRARAGGLDAAFMAIYVPARLQQTGGAKRFADDLIDLVEQAVAAAPGRLAIVRSPAELLRAHEGGRIALPLGIENGAAIEDDLAHLAHFHARGVRYITLTHSEPNLIGDSSYAAERRWHGLSPFGRDVVHEMNRLGIMVDISHVTDETAEDVLEVSTAPVIASHSACRAFTPGYERNISDALIRKVAAGGGMIQIPFGAAFLTAEAQQVASRRSQDIRGWIEEHGLEWSDPRAKEFRRQYRAEHPMPATSIDDVVAHIDHVVDLVGIDHVGFGSDFDGVSTLPAGLEDVSDYPDLVDALLARGYDEAEIRKIAGGNILRVWREVEEIATRDGR
jgi:membrane dipeptidase